jgi:catechol 2,3-dioxygenase-like lactoylglutathione lyase family enzyme
MITRRELLQSVVGAAVAIPTASFGQAGAGAGRGGAQRDTVPLVPPFAATGWKTVWLDHLSYRCADYGKAAAFYVALMGWKVRSDNGMQAVLEIGDNCGDIVMRSGLTAPAPAALTDASPGATRAQAVFDGFAWGIEPWNTDQVKAELDRRGLSPVADHVGSDYKAFHIKDPDGFDVWITNGTQALRRKTAANEKLRASLPFAPTNWTTRFVDHLSFEVADYRRTTAFYQALLGWRVRSAPGPGPAWPDSPNSFTVQISDAAGAIIRNGSSGQGNRGRGANAADSAARPASPSTTPTVTATIGHISFGIANWDKSRVRAELIERGIVYDINGQRVPRDDMAGGLESYHVPDAMGWDLQISNRVTP